MKKKTKVMLGSNIIIASLLIGANIEVASAWSISFRSVTNFVSDSISYVGNVAGATINGSLDILEGGAQFVMSGDLSYVIDGVVNGATTFTSALQNCDEATLSDGIKMVCFDSNEKKKIRYSAINILKNDMRKYQITRGGSNKNAYQHMTRHTSKFVDGEKNLAYDLIGPNSNDAAAYYPSAVLGLLSSSLPTGKKGPIVLNSGAFKNVGSSTFAKASIRASLFVHEADHGRFGGHSSDSRSDTSDDGPYGTEVRHLIQLYNNGHPKVYLGSDCNAISTRIDSIINNNIKDSVAKERLRSLKRSQTIRYCNSKTHYRSGNSIFQKQSLVRRIFRSIRSPFRRLAYRLSRSRSWRRR